MALTPAPGRAFVLLDRDGTLIEEKHYLRTPEELRLLPRARAALHRFRALELGVVLATNQSGLARGYFDQRALDAIHERLLRELADDGLHLDGIYVCPHLPDAACACRKPRPGMGLQAAAELGIDLSRSFVIGDKRSDVAWGLNLGAMTFLVRTGHGAVAERTPGERAHHVVDDLLHASERIQRHIQQRGRT
ncbi:HAD family hydrolase [Comamonas sp. JC664]|uniref:D-glycero-alpha-D-manno-heptose-1,7-bisphosphate 7-phosphatase n=1 Tax=Comamonas sp. JC664 TaxID=2801917 RepID=UPI001749015A|nr:HAD family hydrolase [Comamonas sp. JC664]MBL0695543.1 HAD family hydrolase [Comamonas sp. JC664]GHG62145.1 D,D-heptose 1,7-bisphosphate phosphatase [Comamonas sp. KCTC 72670]